MTRTLATTLTLLAVLAGSARTALGQACTVHLTSFGAVNPDNGFPLYYVDSTGLALQACLDNNGLCLLELPNPAAPVAFPANFPDEFFYWSGETDIALPGGGDALLVLAVEGAFVNEVPVAGDQVVFGRVRIRARTLTPGGTYTFTHPFGVDVLQANALGEVNFTEDVGDVGFAGPLASRIGPFLTWTATPPAPPPGFIGDPNVPHTVTGSPCGTNFFRIVGPGLPSGGLRTDFFSIMGKKAGICGNGVLESGEQCDDGNALNGDCCSEACRFEPAGAPCTSTNVCAGTACNGAGVCAFAAPLSGPCDDGNACTVTDTCSGGVCVPGPARNCNDANPCTTDLCTPPTVGCENLPNSNTCNDGNAATVNDSCSGGGCMGRTRLATLVRIAGVDPSRSATVRTTGDGRIDGTRVRVSLGNMDPARFPAGCRAEVRFGSIQTFVPLINGAAEVVGGPVRVTAVHFQANGTQPVGSRAEVRVRCGANETRWQGTLQ